MATLSDKILHTCVGAPTYFDCLPGDVLQFCIIPFLDWEDRIHLNMLTPPGDRTPPKKIPKDRIIAHQLYVSSKEMIAKVHKANNHKRASQVTKTNTLLQCLHVLNKERNTVLYQYSSNFRTLMANKLTEFSDPRSLRIITRVKQREEIKILINELLEKMASHPLIYEIGSNKWLSHRVTRCEHRRSRHGWLPDGTQWRRVKGAIYSVME